MASASGLRPPEGGREEEPQQVSASGRRSADAPAGDAAGPPRSSRELRQWRSDLSDWRSAGDAAGLADVIETPRGGEGESAAGPRLGAGELSFGNSRPPPPPDAPTPHAWSALGAASAPYGEDLHSSSVPSNRSSFEAGPRSYGAGRLQHAGGSDGVATAARAWGTSMLSRRTPSEANYLFMGGAAGRGLGGSGAGSSAGAALMSRDVSVDSLPSAAAAATSDASAGRGSSGPSGPAPASTVAALAAAMESVSMETQQQGGREAARGEGAMRINVPGGAGGPWGGLRPDALASPLSGLPRKASFQLFMQAPAQSHRLVAASTSSTSGVGGHSPPQAADALPPRPNSEGSRSGFAMLTSARPPPSPRPGGSGSGSGGSSLHGSAALGEAASPRVPQAGGAAHGNHRADSDAELIAAVAASALEGQVVSEVRQSL